MGYLKNLKKKAADRWGKKYASSYWYDEYDRTYDTYEKYTEWGLPTSGIYRDKKSVNIYKLASVRRAIANFVQIVTGKNIPVTFSTKSDSKTDGKTVILSADVNDNFDVSVGLALHEGSHIILSDFELLKVCNTGFSKYIHYTGVNGIDEFDLSKVIDKDSFWPIGKYSSIKEKLFMKGGTIRSKTELTRPLFDMIMGLSNWIEDRRIDNYIYTTAPGYRSYYLSLYDHYFNDKIVTKGIASDEFTDETLDSYFFRIINLLNEKTDLNKLKGLREVVRMLDLKNIKRITKSEQSLELAIDIVAKILEYCDSSTISEKLMKGSDGDVNEDDDDTIEIDDLGDDFELSDKPDNGPSKKVRLSPKAMQQLLKKIENQKKFLDGDVKKKKLTATDLKKIENVEQSGTELNRVGQTVKTSGGGQYKGVDCIVVKKLNDSIIIDDEFPCRAKDGNETLSTRYQPYVDRGIELGILLGKKLQIRAESRDTIFSRLKRGKIDKRMISALGYDNDSVFFTHEVDQYKKVNLHISIDYSGSMSGVNIQRSITATVAIVKACIMARNINVQVSIRATAGSPSLPWICMVYDSRRDNFKTFCKYMAAMQPTNITPEGLCFEAIQKYLIPTTNDTDSYFLNFSDGCPSYSISNGADQITYEGTKAAEHTYSQIKKMKESGINVISYFITERRLSGMEHSEDYRIFKLSYRDDAKFINVENMNEVARSMNEMFLKK